MNVQCNAYRPERVSHQKNTYDMFWSWMSQLHLIHLNKINFSHETSPVHMNHQTISICDVTLLDLRELILRRGDVSCFGHPCPNCQLHSTCELFRINFSLETCQVHMEFLKGSVCNVTVIDPSESVVRTRGWTMCDLPSWGGPSPEGVDFSRRTIHPIYPQCI